MQAGLAAALPDRVPAGQRGGVSGWIGIVQTVSVVAAAAQAGAPAIAAPVVTYLGGFSTLYVCVAVVVLFGSASVCRIRSVP